MFTLKGLLYRITTLPRIDWSQTSLNAGTTITNSNQSRTLSETMAHFVWLTFELYNSSYASTANINVKLLQNTSIPMVYALRLGTTNYFLRVTYTSDTSVTVRLESSASNIYLRIYGYGKYI